MASVVLERVNLIGWAHRLVDNPYLIIKYGGSACEPCVHGRVMLVSRSDGVRGFLLELGPGSR